MNRRRLAKQLKSLKTEMESKQPAAHLQKTVIIGPDGQMIDVPVDAYSPGLNVKLQPAISSSSINADLKRRPSAYQLGGLVISTDVKRQPSLNQIKIGPISPGTTAILSGDLEGAKQKAYYDALFGSSPPGTVPASPDATRLYNPINDEDLTDDLFATCK
jgi:hypothetical protein